jgi:HK97 family phage major capsid protein
MKRDEILKRMKEIQTRSAAIAQELAGDGADMEALNAEVDKLMTEKRSLQTQLTILDIQEGQVETRSAGIFNTQPQVQPETRNFEQMSIEEVRSAPEYRSAFLKRLQGKSLTEVEKRAYDSGTTSGGAYVIPTQTSTTLFDKMTKIAPMLNEITLLRVAGNVKFGVEGTRNAAAKHTENAAVTPAADTITYVELGSYEYMKVIRISKTIQTMAINAFEAWLVDMLAEDIAVQIENAIINGDGDGDPKGVAYARTWTAGSTSIEFTNAGAPTFDNVVDMIALLPARYDGNAKFLTSKTFLYSYLAKIKDDSKQPILVRDMVNGLTMRLMGFEVLISDKVDAKTMFLGDFRKVVGNLAQDVTVESSVESGFLSNSIDFRGTAMFDCDIAMADAFIKMTEAAAV